MLAVVASVVVVTDSPRPSNWIGLVVVLVEWWCGGGVVVGVVVCPRVICCPGLLCESKPLSNNASAIVLRPKAARYSSNLVAWFSFSLSFLKLFYWFVVVRFSFLSGRWRALAKGQGAMAWARLL